MDKTTQSIKGFVKFHDRLLKSSSSVLIGVIFLFLVNTPKPDPELCVCVGGNALVFSRRTHGYELREMFPQGFIIHVVYIFPDGSSWP